MVRRFQNKMAVSRLALPVMSVYSISLWLVILAAEVSLWPVFLLFCIGVYLVVELNNRNALMRQYSRMVSCSYMAMMMMCPWLFKDMQVVVVQVCVAASLLLLFHVYQKRSATGTKYYSYLLIGVASMLWPPLLYTVPLYFLCESSFFYSFSLKGFFTSVLAILTPLWLVLPYVVYQGTYQDVIEHYHELLPGTDVMAVFSEPALLLQMSSTLTLHQVLPVVLVIVVALIGIVHYMRNSYADKIQVRMYYNMFILMSLALMLALVITLILPFANTNVSDMLFALLIVFASPLVAHYITFTNTRLTNVSVIALMIAIAAITIYNHFVQYFV